MADYSKLDFKKSLLKIGIKKNDNIFCHSNIGFFGKPKNVNSKNQLCNFQRYRDQSPNLAPLLQKFHNLREQTT